MINTGSKIKVVYLTSWFWEGAFVLNELLENKLDKDIHLIIQAPWWGKKHFYGYSLKYWTKLVLDAVAKVYGGRYYSLQGLSRKHGLKTTHINNINDSIDILKDINPHYIVVVGSRILKHNVVETYRGRIINFHTGILPFYRGPYSEFWAMYNDDLHNIGTTIHLLNEGIDSGDIIDQVYVEINSKTDTPETVHIKNVRAGATLLSKILKSLKGEEIAGHPQKEEQAGYYSQPSTEQLQALSKKLGKVFDISFTE